MLVEDRALDELMLFLEGCGLEAWRRFARRCEPKTIGHLRAKDISSPSQDASADWETRLARWEKSVRDYDHLATTTVNDHVNMGVFQAASCPQEVHEHLTIHAHRFDTYKETKEEISRIVLARRGLTGNRDSDAMEFDAIWKDKGTGKESKGKDKDKSKRKMKGDKHKHQKAQGKAGKIGTFDGNCNWCGRKGHKETDCNFKQQWSDKQRSKGAAGSSGVVWNITVEGSDYVCAIIVSCTSEKKQNACKKNYAQLWETWMQQRLTESSGRTKKKNIKINKWKGHQKK
eukprot:737361-Amphidinium_carterae.1